MKISLAVVWVVLGLVGGSLSMSAQIVINEIMYRPGTTFPENTAREFIELHNRAANSVDLSGWQFTSGISYAFPVGTSISAGGYVVVASSPSQVGAAYGVAGVLGPWAAGTTLSNRSEKIALSRPGTSPGTFELVDEVSYASEGDWALRVREGNFGGWEWQTPANGAGRSMELRNPALRNDQGQNWAPSQSASGATPGSANSALTTNIPPIITKVAHFPAVPTSADPVTISCQVVDETPVTGLAVTLFWRDATSVNAPPFISMPMASDGSGYFSAVLNAMPHLTIVEFYLSATDSVHTRTWPAATSEGQTANAQYQVDNEPPNNADTFYRLVLTGAENAAFTTQAASNPQSDRQFNQTLIVTRGAETTVRYRSSMRIRGNSSRGYQFKPLRISMPNDSRWEGITDFNLNPRSSFLQFIGFRLFQAAGLPASDTIPIELRRNGVESTTSSGSTPDYGKWVRVEELNGDFIDAHFPLRRGGNVYKKGRPDRYWRATQSPPSHPDFTLDGWSKQNNSGANDWTDLTGFFQTWQSAGAPHFPGAPNNDMAGSTGNPTTSQGLWNSTGYTTAEVASLENVSDLEQWARWFAVMTIILDRETNISTGEDDDYTAYFRPDPDGSRRMVLLPHDLDTIFGMGDNPQPFDARGLYDATETNSVFRPLLPLLGTSSITGNAAFRTRYYTALRTLLGGPLNANNSGGQAPPLYQFLDNHLGGWVPAGTIATMKNFATQRQAYLLNLIGQAAIPPAIPSSIATLVSQPGTLMIHEVLANNLTAVNVNGTFPDAIELYNAGSNTVQLEGMSLTDDPEQKTKFVFPAGISIPPGGYLVIYADTSAGELRTGFGLQDGGETVQLYDTIAAGQTLLDSVTFGIQARDYTIGRTGAARDTWALCTPSLGSANTPVAALAAPSVVRINEWLGNIDYQLSTDFLELYNPAPLPVAIGGLTVSDDAINYPTRHTFPPLSFLNPTGFLRLDAVGANATPGNASELPFRLNSSFGFVHLSGANGAPIDAIDLVAQTADTSTGRSPNGSANYARFGLPANVATPGASNINPPANILALMNNLRITELLYTPSNREFIELQNLGASALDLSGVRVTNGVAYIFPPGSTLSAGAFIVICRDRAAFQAQFGSGVPLAPGNFTGALDNAGETVALRPPSPWDINILNFAYDPDWYPETDSGFSLTIRNAATTLPGNWDERVSWAPSAVLYGTPGSDGPPSIASQLSATGYLNNSFQYQIVATKSPSSFTATPLPAGLMLDSGSGLISGTPTAVGITQVTITATNAAGTGSAQLVLTVVPSGPLAGFVWSNIPTQQQPGQPFAVTIRAVDSEGRTVTNFNGIVSLSSGGSLLRTIGTGTGTWDFPLHTFYEDARTQSIYPASDLAGAGRLTALALDVTGLPGISNQSGQIQNMKLFTIRMKHTNLATVSAWEGSSTGWTTVHQSTQTTTETGWNNYVFGTPFDYNGASNLMIDISFNNGNGFFDDWGSPSTRVRFSATPTNRSVNGFTDSGFDDPLNWAGTSSPNANAIARVPNIRLTTTPPATISPAQTASFVDGVWSGSVAISPASSNIVLRADDGAGSIGLSNAFNVGSNSNLPNFISPAIALGVVNRPFSYQIVATNSPTSYASTSLPTGYSLGPSTGLLTVSPNPTVAATFTVMISATNSFGTNTIPLEIQIQADADGDGIGDAWETSFGLSPANPADAGLDLDGDGQTNRAEWLAGTLPDNNNSRLAVLSETRSGNNVVITWQAAIGKRYRLLTRTDLDSGAYSVLTSTPIIPTSNTATYTHINGAVGPSRFYRIEVLP